jgi:hypothetical protein
LLKSVVGIFSTLAGGWLDKTAYESYQPMNPVEIESEKSSETGNE